ncbi:MAG: nucleoside monophosphate kinase [Verrucomicrobiia bacterium]|jgi:adenylate kinase
MQTKSDRSAWLKGPAFPCEVVPANVTRPWRLVLLGAPGVGKGTQAELLTQRLGACHLSTGDIFRTAKSLTEDERSPAMTAALEYMRRGDLVPDATVLQMVRERVSCLRCSGGFLLDGFPRTVAQAEALQTLLQEQNLALDAVLDFELPIDEIVARLAGRRTCSTCKAVYHVTGLPPKKEGICDKCGGSLVQREDDRPESVRVRMEVYEKSTAPLTDFYRRLGLLVPIAAQPVPEGTLARTLAALQSRDGNTPTQPGLSAQRV